MLMRSVNNSALGKIHSSEDLYCRICNKDRGKNRQLDKGIPLFDDQYRGYPEWDFLGADIIVHSAVKPTSSITTFRKD
jgi:hypothetical protein